MSEIPVRFPPPLSFSRDITPVVIECGKMVRLRGKLVICIRDMNHPVNLLYGHSNGYDEWCFEDLDLDNKGR